MGLEHISKRVNGLHTHRNKVRRKPKVTLEESTYLTEERKGSKGPSFDAAAMTMM
jgi:hypothetical protein